MKYFYLIKLIILLILFPYIFNKEQISLYSSSSSLLSLVSGLTANFHCSVRRCTKIIINKDFQSISWYHEGILLFNGTEFEPTSGIEPSRIILQHSLEEIRNEEENNEEGSSCIVEEYSLLLRNLSQEDSGKYSCSINGRNSQQLDFNLNVLGDNSLKLNFPSNLTYDHTECCIERGVSPICRPMCRPRNIGEEFFDPTSCQVEDYKNFLHCVTDGGKRDYVPCCRKKSLPPFCFDFCRNNFQKLKKSHRLCLYFLPDIFDCFSQQYALFPPSAPKNLQIREDSNQLKKLCFTFETPKNLIKFPSFIVHLQEINEIPGIIGKDAAVEEFRKIRKRNSNNNNNNTIQQKIYVITLIKELKGEGTKPILITKIFSSSNEMGINSEICVPLETIHKLTSIYLIYVEASNDYGISEPSKSFLLTEDGKMNPAK